jgi:probable HAF family extracellular repeat protein
MNHWMKSWVNALLSAIVLASTIAVAHAQSLTWITDTEWSGCANIYPSGVSADGSVVVGVHENQCIDFIRQAFRWTQSTGVQLLPPNDNTSAANAISADGSVVVGQVGYFVIQAARWTSTGVQVFGPWSSSARAVSADGSVIVGSVDGRAARWTGSGYTLIGPQNSVATGVSADGSVVVGYLWGSDLNEYAFRWTQDDGLVMIGPAYTRATAVSADGSVVVGSASASGAFLWTQGSGIEYIPNGGTPYGISADGSVIVGRGAYGAYLWTRGFGMLLLETVFENLLGDGSFDTPSAISANGRYIVGWGAMDAHGYSPAGFLLDIGFLVRTDVDGNGCVDDADLLTVLFAFGSQGASNADINQDGIVDDADLLLVLFNFGFGC